MKFIEAWGDEGYEVAVQVEVCHTAPPTHALGQEHQMVLRQLQELEVMKVTYFLQMQEV